MLCHTYLPVKKIKKSIPKSSYYGTTFVKSDFTKFLHFLVGFRSQLFVYFFTFQVRCCGANGSEDYIAALKPVPMECRDRIDGGEYPYGCAQNFAWWLEPWSAGNEFQFHEKIRIFLRKKMFS